MAFTALRRSIRDRMLSHPKSPQSRTVSGFLGGASYSAPRYEAHRQPTEQQEQRYTWQGDWGSDSLSSDDEEAFYERVEEDSLEDALLWDPVLNRGGKPLELQPLPPPGRPFPTTYLRDREIPGGVT
ncbi:hypothetical protein DPEC_G00110530 [Dallia pectoralis]|uniref:Uncharacterized protein n=1 Tax=Dallia pectoralis TaxID=75939 RepID=A0ACC2GT71_DALPE|nr:hypothetical protein DPEC_G00110530 [Dallia pectoralis]